MDTVHPHLGIVYENPGHFQRIYCIPLARSTLQNIRCYISYRVCPLKGLKDIYLFTGVCDFKST